MYFTCGRVSDQRSEGTNSAIKANGQLKEWLSQCSLSDSVNTVFQVMRDREKAAIDELVALCEACTSKDYSDSVQDSKSHVIQFSSVMKMNPDPGCCIYLVRKYPDGHNHTTVNLKGEIMFCGKTYNCVTCSCPFFMSTRRICSCACATAQFAWFLHKKEFNIDDPENIYPYFLVYNHPKWEGACKQLGLSVHYEYMPNYVTNWPLRGLLLVRACHELEFMFKTAF